MYIHVHVHVHVYHMWESSDWTTQFLDAGDNSMMISGVHESAKGSCAPDDRQTASREGVAMSDYLTHSLKTEGRGVSNINHDGVMGMQTSQ